MTAPAFAFFDDYPNEDRGHHPELIFGLAEATARVGEEPVTVYCPPSYLGESTPRSIVHRPCEGPQPYTLGSSHHNLSRAVLDLATRDEFLVNLFLDENYESFPLRGTPTAGIVHVLHRPGPDPRGPGSPRIALDPLLSQRPDDLIVVHTTTGVRRVSEIAPGCNVVRLGWPTVTRRQVEDRFKASTKAANDEPYILMVGGAREDKGISTLMAALANGPSLRVIGEQEPGLEARLESAHPRTRVEWQSGWVRREKIDEAIVGAAVVVFPYEQDFGIHGGASGALAQAIAHPKPLVISTVLAEQAPDIDYRLKVPPGDTSMLRQAIDWALDNKEILHEAALERQGYVLREHTYEGHIEGLISLLDTVR